jgi:hypothetical protein
MMASTPDSPIARELWLERLVRGYPGRLQVRSGSMAPLLQPGEEIVVAPAPRLLLPGDLVVFRQGERLICHRLMLAYGPGRFLQKGDQNREWERLLAEAIVGRPVAIQAGEEVYRLGGAAFRLRNLLLWLLVGLRDLFRLFCRPLPRLTWSCERLFSRPILAIIRHVRKPGGSP